MRSGSLPASRVPATSIARSQEIRVKPGSPLRRSIGWGRRPSARSSGERSRRSAATSPRTAGSSASIVFSSSSRSRTLQRCMPSIVQSRSPAVPSAQPSQTPRDSTRQA